MRLCHDNCTSWNAYAYGDFTDYPDYEADPDIAGVGVGRPSRQLKEPVVLRIIFAGCHCLCSQQLHHITFRVAEFDSHCIPR